MRQEFLLHGKSKEGHLFVQLQNPMEDKYETNGLFTLSPGHRIRHWKNGLYDTMQNVSHYTGSGTPLFPIVLVPVLVTE